MNQQTDFKSLVSQNLFTYAVAKTGVTIGANPVKQDQPNMRS
jgi:hypothetical protein